MRFAVTGGAGFVGSNLVKLLVKKGHDVSVIDNLHTGKLENLEEIRDKIEFKNIDIQDYHLMEQELKNICRSLGLTEDMPDIPKEKIKELYKKDSPYYGELPKDLIKKGV